jgi:hypothetical protein
MNKKLTNTEKKLLNQVEDQYIERIFYYICVGDVAELTPQSCENLMERYIKLQNEKKYCDKCKEVIK